MVLPCLSGVEGFGLMPVFSDNRSGAERHRRIQSFGWRKHQDHTAEIYVPVTSASVLLLSAPGHNPVWLETSRSFGASAFPIYSC
ncbi:hypothetical protein A6V37_29925 [Paraburkholderia ginsengiterrae]|uniref:Uncharacterized protein n=1 Tax=Paraburkholderia ginsengiterrae TaxID=1462993 RepID=A0A1A9N4N7_9BURK|nr:hypothetical protein A6V37_29925 [Paraburkholderia ginsengiterrae]